MKLSPLYRCVNWQAKSLIHFFSNEASKKYSKVLFTWAALLLTMLLTAGLYRLFWSRNQDTFNDFVFFVSWYQDKWETMYMLEK